MPAASAAVNEPVRAIVGRAVQLAREAGSEALEPGHAALLAHALCTEDPVRYSVHAATPETREALAKGVAERFLKRADDPAGLALACQAAEALARRNEEIAGDAARQKAEAMLARLQAAAADTRATERATPDVLAGVNEACRRYVVKAARLIDNDDGPATEEVSTTLQSVVPAHSIGRFIALGKSERREQLAELAHITLGIIIYNRALGRGGTSVTVAAGEPLRTCVSFAADLEDAAARSRAEMEEVMVVCDVKAAALPPRDPAVARLRDEILNRRQHIGAVTRMLGELKQSAQALRAFDEAMLDELAALKALVGNRTAVPKDKVYPRFAQVGTLHLALEDEYNRVKGLRSVYAALREFDTAAITYKSIATQRERSEANSLRRDGGPVMCDQAPAPPADAAAAESGAGVVRVDGATMEQLFGDFADTGDATGGDAPSGGPSGIAEGEEAVFALGGCDPVCIALRAGYLTRADLTLGGVKWGGSYYGFVSEENLNLFAAQPSDYFNLVMNNVKASPPLVGVLGLRKELPACDADEALAIVETPIAREFGTQTPTHFCEKRIDVEYEWNEWALRRKALRLANLRQCVTKSSQSVVSQFRRTSETQVYLPKDQSTQYAVTKGQSMVHPLRYIAGLRGAPDTRMEVVDVGLDMGQPHEL